MPFGDVPITEEGYGWALRTIRLCGEVIVTFATPAPRFLKLDNVCDELSISSSQAYALGRSGDLPAIQNGGRRQWQVERSKLEEYIKRMYELAANNLEKLPVEDYEPFG